MEESNPSIPSELEAFLLKTEAIYPRRLLNIDGLCYFDKFISLEEEKLLLSLINQQPWNTNLTRRTQHYGYVYDYSSKKAAEKTEPIPSWCQFLIDRLIDKNILLVKPDQMIVNEYVPGQGIFPHVDNVHSFEDGIVSLSLGSAIIMDIISNKDSSNKKEAYLARRSVISFHGPARYDWRHGIASRKSDNGTSRGRRVSITFRKMKVSDNKRIRLSNKI